MVYNKLNLFKAVRTYFISQNFRLNFKKFNMKDICRYIIVRQLFLAPVKLLYIHFYVMP
jgi:hypothetical protein